jgi:hypothetical protein
VHQAGRIAGNDPVRRDISGHHRLGRYDRSVADADARHDHRFVADPNIITDDGVAAARDRLHEVECLLGPVSAEDGEGEGGDASGRVIGTGHYETNPGRQRTVAPDNQPLRTVGVEHVLPLEGSRVARVVIVGVIADLDVRRADDRLEEDDTRVSRNRVQGVRPRNIRHRRPPG